MEPTVRGARTQSGIIAAPAQDPELLPGIRLQLRSDFGPKPGRRERNFGCRDRVPKIATRRANAHRDKNLRNEWPEIPAETPYLAPYKWFNTERGFGFIGAARTCLSISLQCSGAGMDRLREGANATFDIVDNRSKPVADNLR
jgi:cold shock CspA family protein